MPRSAVIPWSADDIAEALRDQYRAEPEGVVRTRLHALWLLRQPEAGWISTTVAAALGAIAARSSSGCAGTGKGAWRRCVVGAGAVRTTPSFLTKEQEQ